MNATAPVQALPVQRPRRQKQTRRRRAHRVRGGGGARRHTPTQLLATSIFGAVAGLTTPGATDSAPIPHPGVGLIDPGFDELTPADLVAALPALARTSFWRGVSAGPHA